MAAIWLVNQELIDIIFELAVPVIIVRITRSSV